jgi:hypothetical protein
VGRFVSPDTIIPDFTRSQSWNRYSYVEANPVRYTDPSGLIKEEEATDANKIIRRLLWYSVIVNKDFGRRLVRDSTSVSSGSGLDVSGECADWVEGNWKSVWELEQVEFAVREMARAMGGALQFGRKLGIVFVKREPADKHPEVRARSGGGPIPLRLYDFTFYDNGTGPAFDPKEIHNTVVHELAHTWDINNLCFYSSVMWVATNKGQGQPAMVNTFPANAMEDWADAVADRLFHLPSYTPIDTTREIFVDAAFMYEKQILVGLASYLAGSR